MSDTRADTPDDRSGGEPHDQFDRDPAEGGELPEAGAGAEHGEVRPSVSTDIDPDEPDDEATDGSMDDATAMTTEITGGAVAPEQLSEGLA